MATAAAIPLVKPQTGFGNAEPFVQKARELRPLLMKEAPEGERRRTLSAVVEKALFENNLFTMLMPQRWGGAGLSMTGFARVQLEIGKGDPSVSWVMQIINGTTWVATLTSDACQTALFGQGPKLVCGAYNPPGKARKVDGGYIVNGAWPYTSGSRQSCWAQSGVLFEDTGGPVVPGINMCYIPFSELEMQDTWFVTGMQGTGSDTSVAKDVFVPDHLMVTMDKPFGYAEPNKQYWGAPSDNLPVVPSVRSTGLAQLVGAAEAMLEIVEADSKKKPVVTTIFKTRTESGQVMHDLGEVAAQLDTAKLLLFAATGTLDEIALTGRPFPEQERARHKAQCGQITDLVHKSIESLMFISGSSAFALSNPLSRYWKDTHVALRHITNVPSLAYEIYGRNRMDVKPNISPFGAF
jgi:alkylation response protein AidB-like acyl-CoA dehydrogenase